MAKEEKKEVKAEVKVEKKEEKLVNLNPELSVKIA